jgi:death on curing protein
MMPPPDQCIYLDVDLVERIHGEALRLYGGAGGLRDRALLESAVAAPQATSGGQSVFEDAIEIAAAYLFYLCRNHPFIDGNKRTALGACLIFLQLNEIEPPPDSDAWYELTMGVASGDLDRDGATAGLRRLIGV